MGQSSKAGESRLASRKTWGHGGACALGYRRSCVYQHPPYSGGTDRRAAVRGWHRALATLYSYLVSDQRQGLSLASTNVAAPLVASDTGGPSFFSTSGCSLAACSHTATQRVCRPTSWYSSLQMRVASAWRSAVASLDVEPMTTRVSSGGVNVWSGCRWGCPGRRR